MSVKGPRLLPAAIRVAGAATRACRAHGADIAEEIVEEAAMAAERRGLLAIGIDRGDLLEAGAVDRGDVALLVEGDADRGLILRVGRIIGHVPAVARDI